MSKCICYGCMKEKEREDAICSCGFNKQYYTQEPHYLQLGTMLNGRYLVGKVIGAGGFGITYVGLDTVLDIKVAIKEFFMNGYVMRNSAESSMVEISSEEHVELFTKNKDKFLTEARVLGKFSGESGIVGIRDFFEANNTTYLVMEYLDGVTLADYLEQHKTISFAETVAFSIPILHTLTGIHKQNIIHRDISPDNIMICTNGEVKLLDFGAARAVSKDDIKSLSVILKPGYAPEEQYRSKGKQGPWTDIYAFCASMYNAITGVAPDDSMERLFEDHLKPVNELVPECPQYLSDILMKGLSVSASGRYQSAEELENELRFFQENYQRAEAKKQNGATPVTVAEDIGGTELAEDYDVPATEEQKTPVAKASDNSVAEAEELTLEKSIDGSVVEEIPQEENSQLEEDIPIRTVLADDIYKTDFAEPIPDDILEDEEPAVVAMDAEPIVTPVALAEPEFVAAAAELADKGVTEFAEDIVISDDALGIDSDKSVLAKETSGKEKTAKVLAEAEKKPKKAGNKLLILLPVIAVAAVLILVLGNKKADKVTVENAEQATEVAAEETAQNTDSTETDGFAETVAETEKQNPENEVAETSETVEDTAETVETQTPVYDETKLQESAGMDILVATDSADEGQDNAAEADADNVVGTGKKLADLVAGGWNIPELPSTLNPGEAVDVILEKGKAKLHAKAVNPSDNATTGDSAVIESVTVVPDDIAGGDGTVGKVLEKINVPQNLVESALKIVTKLDSNITYQVEESTIQVYPFGDSRYIEMVYSEDGKLDEITLEASDAVKEFFGQ